MLSHTVTLDRLIENSLSAVALTTRGDIITYHDLLYLRVLSLTFKYKLYCDANYYSSDCSVYCVASDTDAAGHYTCDPATGNITCRSGTVCFVDTSENMIIGVAVRS